jgi:hypothetical protein
LGEVRGNLALALGQNLLKLRNGQLFLFEEKEDPQAIGIGGQPEGFQD